MQPRGEQADDEQPGDTQRRKVARPVRQVDLLQPAMWLIGAMIAIMVLGYLSGTLKAQKPAAARYPGPIDPVLHHEAPASTPTPSITSNEGS